MTDWTSSDRILFWDIVNTETGSVHAQVEAIEGGRALVDLVLAHLRAQGLQVDAVSWTRAEVEAGNGR